MFGPLQLIVIAFDSSKYAREIILEIKSLRQRKVIRLFDLLYIMKHEDGTLIAKEASDLDFGEKREYGQVIKSLIGLSGKNIDHVDSDEIAAALDKSVDVQFGLSEDEIQGISDDIPDGHSAIFVIFEHMWARGLKEAMRNAGGYVQAQGFIDPETLQEVTNELAVVVAAIKRTETAAMEKMAGVVTDVKAQEEQARLLAAAAIAEAEAMKEQAAIVLAEAEQKEKEAAQAVADALEREETARTHAEAAIAEAQASEDTAFADAEAVRRAAQRQQEKAQAEAARVVAEADEIEAKAVIRAMNALESANVISRAATREALDTIIDARVIDRAAARNAMTALR